MKRILFIIIVAISFTSAFGQDNKRLFEQANDAYQKGDYNKASEEYNKILQQGYESAEVYYNLGNCFYKMNQIPPAILNYERAAQLKPDDSDIEFNLKLANLKIVDKIEPLPGLFYQNWWSGLAGMFSSRGWAIVLIVSFSLTAVAAILFFLINSVIIKKVSFALVIVFLFSSIFSFVLGDARKSIETSHNAAIIFEPSVYVKSSPSEKGTDLFILHEGTKVKLLDKVGRWEKIQTPDGNEGWVSALTLEAI